MQWRRIFFGIKSPRIAVVCASCGGQLYGNPHPTGRYLNAAMWLVLGATLYSAFSKASIFLVGASAVAFCIVVATYWYVSVRVLRDWPAFRSEP
jgi:hypothetical protein